MNKKCPIAVFRSKEVQYFIFCPFSKFLKQNLYLLFELRQLCRQLSHQSDGVIQFILQAAHLVLLALSLVAHQRHGSHTGEPLQILLLIGERWGRLKGIKRSKYSRLSLLETLPGRAPNAAENSLSSERSSNFWHVLIIFDIMLKAIEAKKENRLY